MNVLRLIPEEGGEPVTISLDHVLIGRDPDSDIHLRDVSVSRRHAEIRRTDDEWVVIDLESGNGVFLDGERTPVGVLGPGKMVQFGKVLFRVEIDRGSDGATVILGRSPFAASDATLVGGPPLTARRPAAAPPSPQSPPGPTPRARSGVRMALLLGMAGLGVIAASVLGTLYYRSTQRPSPATPSLQPRPRVVAAAVPATSAPSLPALPPPVTRATAAPPRARLFISTSARVEVSVDGRREGTLAAGGSRRLLVAPGDHIVTFRTGLNEREDRVVRTEANEQTLVHYSAIPAVAFAPSPAPVATLAPTPTVTPVVVARGTPLASANPPSARPAPVAMATATPVPQAPTPTAPAPAAPPLADEGVVKGAAANASGDFYRAALILKDVTKRLEASPQSKKELARAHAHLAWAYQGLGRPDEARAEVSAALKADPGLVVGLEEFPAQVVSLFKRAR